MSRTFRLLALASAAAMLASGCALQDTRYDYSRNGLPFADYDESILDWNFPTTTSQGLLKPVERVRPWRPAIGVPWANGNPMPWQSIQLPLTDSASDTSASAHDPAELPPAPVACDGGCVAPGATPLRPDRPDADAGVRDGVVARSR
jgi:hypothetical protein